MRLGLQVKKSALQCADLGGEVGSSVWMERVDLRPKESLILKQLVRWGSGPDREGLVMKEVAWNVY